MRLAAVASIVGAVTVSREGPQGCLGDGTVSDPVEIDVVWTFPDGPGEGGVYLVGCSGWGFEVSSTGEFAGMRGHVGTTPCAVAAWRRDGQLTVRSEPIPVTATSALQVVDFGLPAGPIAGVGIAIEEVDGGIRITQVLAGLPADAAGLRPGMHVTHVDGLQTSGLSASAFVRAATGAPGTVVSYTIEGSPSAVDIERVHVP